MTEGAAKRPRSFRLTTPRLAAPLAGRFRSSCATPATTSDHRNRARSGIILPGPTRSVPWKGEAILSSTRTAAQPSATTERLESRRLLSGELDSSFGDGGRFVVDLGDGYDSAN